MKVFIKFHISRIQFSSKKKARMATQKSQDQALEVFNELARAVSTGVEQAHGIGKRRDERTPPTMPQLSEIAHTVVQLLLQPFASVLYQNNRGKLPENLEQVRVSPLKFKFVKNIESFFVIIF